MPRGGWPGVVFVHGYIPPISYKTTSNYNSFVYAIASKNIVVLKIDLRGHGTSEGTASGSYYSSDYVIDTLNAYSALTISGYVDPNNTALWGHSMAGNIILRSVVAHQKISKAIIWAGAGFTYSDLQTLRISDNSYRPPPTNSPQQQYRQALFQTHGQFDPNSSFWKLVPPTNYLTGIKTKIQLHHAVNDNVVSIEYSRNLNKVLKSLDISTTLYEYPTGGHNLTGNTFTSAINRTVDFIKSTD